MRRRLVALALLVALASWPTLVRLAAGDADDLSAPPVPVVTLDVLPLSVSTAALPLWARARAEGVLAGSIFAQRVEGIRFSSREPVYRFLLDHPDFAAGVARALRLGEYRVSPREDGYWGDDNRGAKGMLHVLFTDDSRRLYYLEGRYDRPLLPTIEGRLLILLEFHHEADERGATLVTQSLTGHVRIDTPLVGAVAHLLGALSRSLVERAVERKVRRFFGTVARVSRWAHDEPEQLVAALDGHPEVPANAILAEFRTLLLEGRPPGWARGPFHLIARDSLRLDEAGPE
jgi:hypothetical protein